MNKKQFLEALGKNLTGLPLAEQDKWLDFYGEMIDDRMEDGLTETEAVAAIGSVEEIGTQILAQSQPKNKPALNRVLLIVGSPIWFSLLLAILAVAWLLVVGFYAVSISLLALGLAGVVLLPIFLAKGNAIAGLFSLGAGLICAGLGVFCFIGTGYVTKAVIWLCKKLFLALRAGKEAAV